MVFNDTINNITVISWRSVLLAEDTSTSRSTRYRTLSLQTVTFRKIYCAAVAEKS